MSDPKVARGYARSFPETRNTWIGQRLERGGQGLVEVRDYVMRLYAGPLMSFCKLSPMARWCDPNDLVQGFLAERLAKDDYFLRWSESGKRLHQWLALGLNYYGREELHRRQRGGQHLEVPLELASSEPEAHRALELATQRSFLGEGIRRAEWACIQRGQETHWKIFMRRSFGQESFREIAKDLGLTPEQAVVMMRIGKKRLLAALREVLKDDGVREENLQAELDWVLGRER